MATLTLNVNPNLAVDTLVPDLGVIVPGTGTLVFNENEEIYNAQASEDLRTLLTDDAIAAVGTMTVTGAPTAGDQVEFGGVTLTAAGATTATTFDEGAGSPTLVADSIIAAFVLDGVVPTTGSAVNAAGVITFTATAAGTAGNAITLSIPTNVGGVLAVSGPTLTGGGATLQADDGGTVPQGIVLNFLDTILLPDATNAYGVVTTNEVAEIETDLDFDGTAVVNNMTLGTALDANSQLINNLAPGVAGTDAVNLDQLNSANRVWKELIMTCLDQPLNGASGGIRSLGAFYLEEQPTAADTLDLDATALGAETFTAVAGAPAAFEYTIGGTVDITLQNLVDAINTDSTSWGALLATTLQSINDGTGSVTAGLVVLIYELAAASTTDSRMWGTFASGVPTYVNFFDETDYSSSIAAALPGADPGQKEFGFGRSFAELVPNETHVCRAEDTIITWDSDAEEWQNTGTNAGSPKLLQYGQTSKVPGSGTLFLRVAGNVLGSAVGKRMIRSGTITGLSIEVDTAVDAARTYKLSVEKSLDDGATWSEAVLLTLAATTFGSNTTSPTAGAGGNSYAAGNLLRASVVRTAGAGASNFGNIDASVEISA